MSSDEVNMYDVSKYSDDELYQLMDLDSPSDRELEAKIHMMIKKYRDMTNAMGRKMHNFFVDIFQHFFETEDDDDTVPDEEQLQEGFEIQTKGNWKQADLAILNTDQTNYDVSQSILPKRGTKPAATYGIGEAFASTVATNQIGYQKSIDYTKGTLNPLLKETILRIVSIDSQFRDLTVYPYSTDFTFNLSETLQNVVSLKLYSVQIPYTWYTISLSYGSNFFILKPRPGSIVDYEGNYDYKIEIPSGNYQAIPIQNAINSAIETIKSDHPDVSFGKTGISYNSVNTRATLTLDVTSIYNESNYRLEFPPDPSYNNQYVYGDYTTGHVTTIQQMLGFKNKHVSVPANVFNVYSRPFLTTDALRNTMYTAPDVYFTVRLYECSLNDVDPFNVTASEYSGGGEAIPVSRWDLRANPDPPVYDLSGLLDSLQTSLQACSTTLDATNSGMQVVPLDYVPSGMPDRSYSMMQLSLRTNRYYRNDANLKAVVDFGAVDPSGGWWNVLGFDSLYETSNLYGDVSSAISNFYVNSRPYLYFKCITPGYALDNNDISMTILPPPTSVGYYTLDGYVAAVNLAMKMAFDTSYNRQSTCTIKVLENNIGIPPQVQVKLQRIIPAKDPKTNTTNFTLDFTQCFLHTEKLGFPDFLDISSNATLQFTTTSISTTTMYLSSDRDNSQNNIIRIISSGANNSDVSSVTVHLNPYREYPPPGNKPQPNYWVIDGTSYGMFQTYINKMFDNTYGDLSGNIRMTGTSFMFNNGKEKLDCQVSFKISAWLTNTDYALFLYDPSGYDSNRSGVWKTSTNSWYNYLNFGDPSYALTADTMTLNATSRVLNNVLMLNNTNNYFWFTPNQLDPKGAFRNTKTIDHRIKVLLDLPVDPNVYYTKKQVVNNINRQLSRDPRTYGSYIDITSEITRFRVNINEAVTTQDYLIHFFDQQSFTSCNDFGSIQNTNRDTTLGWLLGFRNLTIYDTSMVVAVDEYNHMHYLKYPTTPYTYDAVTRQVTVTSDTSITMELYNYFLLIIDDYTQNHLNDGLVTITSTEKNTSLPSYATRNMYKCDPSGNIYTGDKGLTANQIYAANQILNAQPNAALSKAAPYFSQGPFVQDIFGIIPMKTSGLSNGQVYIEFGGTLQIQQRMYFGPVNIKRMTIRLLTDKGTLVDLNRANWSFSLIAEQLYTPSKV